MARPTSDSGGCSLCTYNDCSLPSQTGFSLISNVGHISSPTFVNTQTQGVSRLFTLVRTGVEGHSLCQQPTRQTVEMLKALTPQITAYP